MIYIGFSECEKTPTARSAAAHKLRDKMLSLSLPEFSPDDIFISPGGKPRIEGASFSLSHSGGGALCAVRTSRPLRGFLSFAGEGEVGADMELLREYDFSAVVQKYFFEKERTEIKNPSDFFRIWTRKEALCKLSGEGLSALRRTDTSVTPPEIALYSDIIFIGGERYIFSVACEKS